MNYNALVHAAHPGQRKYRGWLSLTHLLFLVGGVAFVAGLAAFATAGMERLHLSIEQVLYLLGGLVVGFGALLLLLAVAGSVVRRALRG